MAGTAENDTLYGYATADSLSGLRGDDIVYGKGGNDTLDGGAGEDQLNGEDGDDTLLGGTQNDRLDGGTGVDNLQGQEGDDTLYGQAGNDTLDGGTGNDTLDGGAGNDTYLFGVGSGKDTISAYDGTAGKLDVIQLGTGIASTGVTLKREGDVLVLSINGTSDTLRVSSYFTSDATAGYQVEQIRFADGTTWDVNAVKAMVMAGTAENDTLYGYATADSFSGLAGDDTLYGRAGNDTLDGGNGEDLLYGEDGDDVLLGGDGNDILTDTSGKALFNGGAGADSMTGGASAEIFLGGLGDDTYTTAGGNDIILFNKGDGQDTFATGGTGSDTLSLGGSGLAYADLSFTKSTNDLVLKVGTTDQITFKDWYAATPSKPVTRLQVMAEAMTGFAQGGSDPLLEQKVENFNFTSLVGAFDAARTANPSLTSWALTNALTSFQLAGSDTAAMGGDLAYQYGKSGTLAGIGVTPALNTLSDTNLGTNPQALNSLSSLQTGSVRLS